MTYQNPEAADRPEDGGTARPKCRRLFSVDQAADHAGVPPQRMLHWIRTGRLEPYRLHGGRSRIDEVELDAFLSSPGADDGA